MITSQKQIDRQPFRSRADREREASLQTHYQSLALPAVVAAVQFGAKKAATETQLG